MTDEPQEGGGEGRPKGLTNKLTAWVGGLTGLVVALAGLKAAYNELSLSKPPAPAADVQQNAPTTQTDDATNDTTNDTNTAETAAPAALPTSYSGEGVKMEWVNREWVVTDKDGEWKYDQQGDRGDGMTYARTYDGKYELRWKNDGGDVELSDDAEHTYWRHYYSVKPADS
jgi:hypothetical protein